MLAISVTLRAVTNSSKPWPWAQAGRKKDRDSIKLMHASGITEIASGYLVASPEMKPMLPSRHASPPPLFVSNTTAKDLCLPVCLLKSIHYLSNVVVQSISFFAHQCSFQPPCFACFSKLIPACSFFFVYAYRNWGMEWVLLPPWWGEWNNRLRKSLN